MSKFLFPLVLILALALPVLADAGRDAATSFNQGNAKYRDQDFPGAVELYEKAMALGVRDAGLNYNAGCAYFRTGDYGRALLNFERAARLAPRDKDIANNLEEAARYTIDKIDPLYNNLLMKGYHTVLFYLSLCEWIFLLTLLFTLTAIFFIVRVWMAGKPIVRRLRWLWRTSLLLTLLVQCSSACAIAIPLSRSARSWSKPRSTSPPVPPYPMWP